MPKEFKKEDNYKIGIISYNINTTSGNFGAALHSWAFQKYLDKLNVSNVIIDYSSINNKSIFKHPLKNFRQILRLPFALYKRSLIKQFFIKNCVITKNSYYKDEIENYNGAEAFCVETDVTWTPGKNQNFNKTFMCEYPNMKNKENIAYSVDFGSKFLSDSATERLKEHSKNFKHISFRNVFKLDYIKGVIERPDVCVTIDPTLLLEEEDYLPITKDVNMKDYVLVYNCKENHRDMVKQAKKFAKKNKLKIKIINCYDKKLKRTIGIPTCIGIEEFLGYIKNAKYFFTNSYHGICFSLIFKKDFFAYSRGNHEKISTILNLSGLENRYIENELESLAPKPIDYNTVYKKLENIKEESKNWLKQIFSEKTQKSIEKY